MLRIAISACFIFLLLTQQGSAQPLTVDAGNDTVYCGVWPPTYPTLGGSPSATGGVPPYVYEWSCPQGTMGWYLLDSPNVANPKVISGSLAKSEIYRLKVTDSTGAIATDSVIVHFSRWICVTAECYKVRGQFDTVTVSPLCHSYQPPYSFLWSHGQYLSDSTANHPRCWVPSTTTLSVKMTDALGCYMVTTCSVRVSTATVPEIGDDSSISISPNPANANSILHIPAAQLGGIVTMYTPDGKIIARKMITAERTILADIGILPAGILFYRYEQVESMPFTGRLVVTE